MEMQSVAAEQVQMCSGSAHEVEAQSAHRSIHCDKPHLSCSSDAKHGACTTCDVAAFNTTSDLEDAPPFSIRGYVAAVREMSLSKCWPFSQKLLAESIREGKHPLLPPFSPCACVVQLRGEYYHDEIIGSAHEDMDEAYGLNDGPQIQVQIDLSKCEPELDAHARADTTTVFTSPSNLEKPPTDAAKSQDVQVPWSSHKQVAASKHAIPFLDGALVFKKQAPRSIREIRKNVMQGCHCFKRTDTPICKNDTCRESHAIPKLVMDSSDCLTLDSGDVQFCAGAGKNYVADHENVSDITQQDSSRKDYDAGNGISVLEKSFFGVSPDTICKSLKDMKKDSHHIPPAANKANVPLHLQAEMCETAHAISEYTTIRGRLSDPHSVDKSLESHSSKSPASRLCSDNITQQDSFDRMPCLDNIPQQRCPVCLLFQSSSNTALNAHIDRCLAASSTEVEKTKSKLHKAKVRKKRSMAELCLVAPPCVTVDEVPSIGPKSGRSKHTKESTPLASIRRQKAIDRLGLQRTHTAVGGSCQQKGNSKLKSQAKTLKFLQWRSRASGHDQQKIPHGASRRGAFHEKGIPNIKNKRFLGRTREWKTKSVLRKTRNWKRRKVNHESVTEVTHNALDAQDDEAHKLGTVLQRDRKSHNDDLFEDALPCLPTALMQSKIDKVSKTLRSKFSPKNRVALSRKERKPQNTSTQAAHVITSDTVMTVIGSRKTTLEFLQTDDHINDDIGQGVGNVEKVQFRVHIKPAKKRKNKCQQRSTPDVNDASDLQLAIIRIPSIPERNCDAECIADRADTHLEHSPMQTCSGRAEVSLETEIPCQMNFSKQGNSSPSSLRRVAEEWSLQDPSLPLFSSMIEERQGEARGLPNSVSIEASTTDNSGPPFLNSTIPKSNKSGGSRPFECASKCFRDMDNVSMLHLGPQPNRVSSLRNHPAACAAQAWHSLHRESGRTQETDCQQAQAASLFLSTTLPDPNIVSRQPLRRFPFSLCTADSTHWPRNFEQGKYLMAGSEDLRSSVPGNRFIQPLQVAQITGMSGASSRSQELAARQDTLQRDILIAETGRHVSFLQQNAEAHRIDQSSTQSVFRKDHSTAQNTSFQTSSRVETWQAQNLPQKLPPWMQAAIQEQRSPAFPAMDFSTTNSVGHSCVLNATPNINTEASRGSSMFDMIGNPVLRLMGKTMVLMPQAQQGQIDLTGSSHINGQSNYINFLQSLDPGEVNHITQWNESRPHTQPGIITQDYLSRAPMTHRNNGVQSWISSESRSIPQLQDFILRTPSSHGNFPLANTNSGSSQLSGRDIAAQDVNAHPLHPSGSPLLSATFHRAHTNWQNVKDPTPFQPNSGLFCQHSRMMPGSTFSESRVGNSFNSIMPQVHANGCGNPMHATQNVPNMMPQRPKTIISSTFPSWLSNASRTQKAHEPAKVIVLDDEDISDTTAPTPSRQPFSKPAIPAAPQTQQSHLAEARATIPDSCHAAREKLKNKRFIPIIYTVGGSFGESQFLPGVSGPKLQFRLARDRECREVENSQTIMNTRKRLGGFDPQPEARAKIVRTNEGDRPAGVTRTDGNAACNIGPPNSSHSAKQIPSMEALRVAADRIQGTGCRRTMSPPEMHVSTNASNRLLNKDGEQCQPAVNLSKGSRSLALPPTKLHAPIVGMCSTNMNPAEVDLDCQDAGAFMSTPSMSCAQAVPVHNGMDVHSSLNAFNQPQAIVQTQEPRFANLPPTSSTGNTQNEDFPSATAIVNMQGCASLPGLTPTSLRSHNVHLPMIYDSSKKPSCGTPSTVNGPFTLLPDGCPDNSGMPQECSSSRIRSSSEATAPSHGMQSLKVAGKFVIMNGRVSLMDVQRDKGSIYAHMTDVQNERGSTSMQASVIDVQKEKEVMHAHGPDQTLNMSNNEDKEKAPGNGCTRIRGCDDGLEVAAAVTSSADERMTSVPTVRAM